MPPKLNRRRALFVLTKIDEILAGNGGRKPSATPASSNWAAICAKSGRVNTGGWRTSSPSTSFWRGASRNRGGKPTT